MLFLITANIIGEYVIAEVDVVSSAKKGGNFSTLFFPSIWIQQKLQSCKNYVI